MVGFWPFVTTYPTAPNIARTTTPTPTNIPFEELFVGGSDIRGPADSGATTGSFLGGGGSGLLAPLAAGASLDVAAAAASDPEASTGLTSADFGSVDLASAACGLVGVRLLLATCAC